MITNTEYGTWIKADPHSALVEDTVAAAFGEAATDGYDFEAICDAYRDAINTSLPEGVFLAGKEFYGPYYEADRDFDGYPLDEDGHLDIRAIVEDVDLGEIIARHELWDAARVAEELGYTGPHAAATARKALSRWGLKGTPLRTLSSRWGSVWLAGEVMDAQAAAPGRGTRTDRIPVYGTLHYRIEISDAGDEIWMLECDEAFGTEATDGDTPEEFARSILTSRLNDLEAEDAVPARIRVQVWPNADDVCSSCAPLATAEHSAAEDLA